MKITACRLYAATLLTLPCLAGCGGSRSPKNTSGPIFPAPRSVSATLSNGLTGTVTEDRSTVPVGGTVNYTVTLTNSTTQPITFGFTVGPSSVDDSPKAVPARIIVSDPSGKDVSLPPGQAQIVTGNPSFTLAPGQSFSSSEAVNTFPTQGLEEGYGYNSAGIYTANAIFGLTPASTSQYIEATTGPLTVTAQ